MTKEWDPDNVFEVIGSEQARQILAYASLEPMSAEELAERCDTSLPTVYRRVNALQKYDMLTENLQVDNDGHHYKTFETSLKRVCFEIDDGQFEVDIRLQRDLVDQFTDFWTDLEQAGSSAPDQEERQDE